MNSIFNIDSPVMTFLNRLADMIILNLLYVICCLPVFTIGAATSALYYQTMKMSKNEESYAVRGFFEAFRENFRKATPAWLIYLVVGILLTMDLYIAPMLGSELIGNIFRCICFFALLIWMIGVSYTFPLFSKFENTVKNTITNSLLMGIRHLPYTLVILVVNLTPLLAVLFLTRYLGVELLLMLMIWFSGIAYINGLFFYRIFANYIPAETETAETAQLTDENTEEGSEQ